MYPITRSVIPNIQQVCGRICIIIYTKTRKRRPKNRNLATSDNAEVTEIFNGSNWNWYPGEKLFSHTVHYNYSTDISLYHQKRNTKHVLNFTIFFSLKYFLSLPIVCVYASPLAYYDTNWIDPVGIKLHFCKWVNLQRSIKLIVSSIYILLNNEKEKC